MRPRLWRRFVEKVFDDLGGSQPALRRAASKIVQRNAKGRERL
jgi:hypothetical protein